MEAGLEQEDEQSDGGKENDCGEEFVSEIIRNILVDGMNGFEQKG